MDNYFKPMLASDCTDISKLSYPVLASTKLDGVRATVQDRRLISRSLKPIPNKHLQEILDKINVDRILENLDGELIIGNPCEDGAFRRTTSTVMSINKLANSVRFHVFDHKSSVGFEERLFNADKILRTVDSPFLSLVQHVKINNQSELEQLEEAWLELGHEGVMIRSINGRYKEGRSTESEGLLLKLKRFQDSEAVILGYYEMNHNENTATINALGRTERSTEKAGMVPAGVLGGFTVRDIATGVEFDLGGGYSAGMRAKYWKERESLIGKLAKYKFFASGSKTKPRFPVFQGFRDERDMG